MNRSGSGGAPIAPLIVVFGESNAGGQASNAALSAGELASRSSVRIWHNTSDEFQDLDIGTNNLISHSGLTDNATHGLENGLAHTATAGRLGAATAYLVKAGQGGSTVGSWEDTDANFITLESRYGGAIAELASSGVEYTPLVLISLGINDRIAGTTTGTFKAAMEQLIDDVRAFAGVSTRVMVTNFQEPMDVLNEVYNTVLDEIAAADALVDVVDTTGLPINDSNHWSAQGFRELAERVVDIWFGETGQATAPVASPVAGTYGTAQNVTLTTSVGSIYYTTDGTVPTTASTLYSGPISVGSSQTVKAITVQRGYANSDATSDAYVIAPNIEGLVPAVWLDIQDISTLWQDTAGTTAVTTAGQSIARVDNKGSLGGYFQQGTGTKQPTYQTSGYVHALFDGTDDALVSQANINLSATDKVTVFGAWERTTTVGNDIVVVEHTTTSTAGSFFIWATNTAANNATFRAAGARGSTAGGSPQWAEVSGLATSGSPEVLASTNDIAGDSTKLWVNNGTPVEATGDKGTGNFVSGSMSVGARTGNQFYLAGKLTDIVVFDSLLSDTDRQTVQTYLADKNGATLA